MTDSEKAKESLEKRKGEYWCIKTDNVYISYTEGYKDGFVEGERIGKEKQWKATEKAQKKTSARIKKLEKEKEKLKEYLDKTNNEQTEVILKLEEQIEKMKNVGNCKHSMKCAKWVEQHIYHNNGKCCKNCKDWELAE